MKNTIMFSTVLAALGLGATMLPSAALPLGAPAGVTTGHNDLVQDVRMSRRHRMRRSSSDAGNANMPSRRPAARQYGQTSGGPRR